MSIKNRISDLEHAAGLSGSGCPACAGKDVFRAHYPNEPRPAAEHCPTCGHDLLKVITVAYVAAGARASLTAGEASR